VITAFFVKRRGIAIIYNGEKVINNKNEHLRLVKKSRQNSNFLVDPATDSGLGFLIVIVRVIYALSLFRFFNFFR